MVSEICRVVIPLAYMDIIFWSISEISFWHFFDYLRLESWFAVLWDFNLHRSVATGYPFAFIAISVIVIIRTSGLFIPEVTIHFCFPHFFNGSGKKKFQGILNIFSSLNIVFFQELMDNVLLSFCQLYPMDSFLCFAIIKGPSTDLGFIIEELLIFTYLQKSFTPPFKGSAGWSS